jgi:L-fuconolactonase
MIIDAHQHFWWTARRTHTWPDIVGDRMNRDFTPGDLLPELRRAGVDGTVLVQSLNDLDETREYLDLAREHDFIRAVVGWIPLIDPKDSARILESLRERGKIVGIRHLISFEPDPDWILQNGVMESLKHLAAHDLAFDAVPMNFRQMESVFAVAERLPDLKIVMNHWVRPPIVDQGWEPWASMVRRAAGYPNVAAKLSIGIDIATRWRWNTSLASRYADHLIGQFTPDRVMAASNWPVVLLGASFAEIWDGITALVSGLSEAERRAVLGGTAARIYGLG